MTSPVICLLPAWSSSPVRLPFAQPRNGTASPRNRQSSLARAQKRDKFDKIQTLTFTENRNRVDCEWFRHSITALVSGVVFEIGHQAHHRLQITDPFDFSDEYLDPRGNYDDTLSSVELHTPPAKRRSCRPADTANYYGFEPAETHAAEERIAIQLAQPLLPRHQMTEGWRAISKYAAGPLSYNAAAECEGTIAALVQPRENLGDCRPDSPGPSEVIDEEQDNDEEEEQDPSDAESEVCMMPVAKRQRVSERLLSPTVAPSRSSSSVDRAGPSPGTSDQARNRVPWTKEEERLLVQLRDNGEDWTVIHRVSFFVCSSPTLRN